MTKEQIIQLMAEAGLKPPARGDFIFIHWDQIALLLAHEREACAKVCDDMASKNHAEHHLYQHQIDKGVRLSMAVGLSEGAAAIRARGNT